MNIKPLMILPALFALGACVQKPESAAGFRLPDGDPSAGQAVFVELDCTSCHQVRDLELPPPAMAGPVTVQLGGDVTEVKTYGELVSSIINPSHKITRNYPAEQVSRNGESLMRSYNDEMTVQQLVDLVAFLQPRYNVVVPDYYYRQYAF